MWRSLLSLVLALLVTMALASAAAYAVLGFMTVSAMFPPAPMWLVLAGPVLFLTVTLYRRFRKRKSMASAASEAPE